MTIAEQNCHHFFTNGPPHVSNQRHTLNALFVILCVSVRGKSNPNLDKRKETLPLGGSLFDERLKSVVHEACQPCPL